MNGQRARLASWGRWPVARVRMLRVGRSYWIRVREMGDFNVQDFARALTFAERMAERYG